MRLEPPGWWYPDTPGPIGRAIPWLLAPASAAYAAVTKLRTWRGAHHEPSLPVICIGNFTAGGTGKTPLAIEIAKRLQAKRLRPVFLSRGYGGTATGPYDVDLNRDDAARVGDEPLLLARTAPVVVSRDRVMGARHIERMDADVIIMDDGMQNPSLRKTLTFAVVDGYRGLGNGWTIPSGPARAPLEDQVHLADAIVINGGRTSDKSDLLLMPEHFAGPILHGTLQPTTDAAQLSGAKVVAFSGIGNPARFYATLEDCGARIVARHGFGDHHVFSESDAEKILKNADSHDAMIVTTEKDLARLPYRKDSNHRSNLRERSYALPVTFTFQDTDSGRLDALLDMAINNRGDKCSPLRPAA